MYYKLTTRHFGLLALFVLFSSWAFAQNLEPEKTPDEQIVEIADSAFMFGGINLAREQYEAAAIINPLNVVAHYMIGICHIKTNNRIKALEPLQKAFAIDSLYARKLKHLPEDLYPDLRFLMGVAHQLRYEFDLAANCYKQYLKNIEAQKCYRPVYFKRYQIIPTIEMRIKQCEIGKEMISKPIPLTIKVCKDLSSIAPDYAPTLTADGNTMVFTSRREGGMSMSVDRDLLYYEDIYTSKRSESGEWSAPTLFPDVNTEGHESALSISADGHTLLIYNEINNGDIFISTFDDKKQKWTHPKPMGSNINSPFRESSAAFSYDNKYLFFTSDRPGGTGGLDIYMSDNLGNGQWGPPRNLGKIVNSIGDETNPILTLDKKYLYFASNGHGGMGGYDLFRSAFVAGKGWQIPENLGYPINSPDNDVNYVPSPNGKGAYISSVKPNGIGDIDIFFITEP